MEKKNTENVSLTDLASLSGEPVPCAGNLPVKLEEKESFWFIENGSVDLFLVESKDNSDVAAPQHLLRLETGNLIPNVLKDTHEDGPEASSLGLIAKGLPGTSLKRLPISSLSQISATELAEHIDFWLTTLTDALSRFVTRPPRPTSFAEPNSSGLLNPGTLSVRRGVVWVSATVQGKSLFMDMVDPSELAEHSLQSWIPITRTSWISILEEVSFSSKSTEALVREGLLFTALASFHSISFHMERLNRQLAVVDDANLERERTTSRQFAARAARTRLFNLYDLPLNREVQVEDTALTDALKAIGRHQGIRFKFPAKSGTSDAEIELSGILDASGVRARKVRLGTEKNWWNRDSTALLAYTREDDRPIALLPGLFGRYRQFNPVSKSQKRVSKELAHALKNDAWMFYQPLPQRPVDPSDLLRVAMHGTKVDLAKLLVTGFLNGLTRIVPALALGFVAAHIVAGGSSESLLVVAISLLGVGVIGALLQAKQGNAMMRFEGRAASRLEAAFWDRLMRLPSGVLQSHPSGDLAMSGMTFQNLRDSVQGVVAQGLLSIVFLLPLFVVVFVIDATLGIFVCGFSLISLLVMVCLGLLQVSPQGRMIRAVRQVAGLLFQIIGGISKLRVENAEGSAYAMWAQDFREQKRAERIVGVIEGQMRAFGVALPFLAGALLILVVATLGELAISVADFLVVYTLFVAFQSAIARFGESFGGVVAILPAFEQMRPLLGAVPEDETRGDPVENLRGEILFDRISFRYDSDGPLVLDDVTIRARPGEFIAIAGESGSGKSTLFRLALGLDRPTAGAIYYDGRDLRNLNLKQVRRLIGAVPQSVQLHPQDLWDNIVAHREEPTVEEVWQAAQAANIEEEIKAMPMGLMTMVGAGGSVLSGGEGQRVSIARSLLRGPRVMLLDEATNWLDNESQAEVMQNLALLTSTRIVIAHRLSTLEQADCIYVLKAGKIVQSGSFEELMEIEGTFRDLVRRQIA